jgi:hypothetical protein
LRYFFRIGRFKGCNLPLKYDADRAPISGFHLTNKEIFCVCGGIIKNEEKGENETEEKRGKKKKLEDKKGKKENYPNSFPLQRWCLDHGQFSLLNLTLTLTITLTIIPNLNENSSTNTMSLEPRK